MAGLVSRLTSKGQATIPAPVRRALGLKPGEAVRFEVKGKSVTLRRVDPLDAAFMKMQQESLSDWDAPEADEAFRDL